MKLLQPASLHTQELIKKIRMASFEIENEWFFVDGSFTSANLEHTDCNTWFHENFVVIYHGNIIGYFEGTWNRPLDIIITFRMISFEKKKSYLFILGLFEYLYYLFECRGCEVFNWTVAIQNTPALKLYEKLISKYCGHKIGIRTHAQKSYSGKVSDIYLFELTKDEYFNWKSTHQKQVDRVINH